MSFKYTWHVVLVLVVILGFVFAQELLDFFWAEQ